MEKTRSTVIWPDVLYIEELGTLYTQVRKKGGDGKYYLCPVVVHQWKDFGGSRHWLRFVEAVYRFQVLGKIDLEKHGLEERIFHREDPDQREEGERLESYL